MFCHLIIYWQSQKMIENLHSWPIKHSQAVAENVLIFIYFLPSSKSDSRNHKQSVVMGKQDPSTSVKLLTVWLYLAHIIEVSKPWKMSTSKFPWLEKQKTKNKKRKPKTQNPKLIKSTIHHMMMHWIDLICSVSANM